VSGFLPEKDRALIAGRLRHANGQDQSIRVHHLRQIGIAAQVDVDLTAIVDRIPEGLLQLLRFANATDPAIVLHPEQDHPAMAVGHGAVGLPQALRQSALRRLEL
jgi:hypothetical protein